MTKYVVKFQVNGSNRLMVKKVDANGRTDIHNKVKDFCRKEGYKSYSIIAINMIA